MKENTASFSKCTCKISGIVSREICENFLDIAFIEIMCSCRTSDLFTERCDGASRAKFTSTRRGNYKNFVRSNVGFFNASVQRVKRCLPANFLFLFLRWSDVNSI